MAEYPSGRRYYDQGHAETQDLPAKAIVDRQNIEHLWRESERRSARRRDRIKLIIFGAWIGLIAVTVYEIAVHQ